MVRFTMLGRMHLRVQCLLTARRPSAVENSKNHGRGSGALALWLSSVVPNAQRFWWGYDETSSVHSGEGKELTARCRLQSDRSECDPFS
jgi:hypothetical protein